MSDAHREAGRRDPRASIVDRQVAQRIRMRRRALDLTQHGLAILIGVTYQQVHNYETGVDRVSAGQLHAIALVLGVDVAFFFENPEPEPLGAGSLS